MLEFFESAKQYRYLLLLVILSGVFMVLSFYYFTMFQMIAAGIFISAVGIFIFDFIDEKVNSGISTITEIVEKRNMALAIYYLCYAVIIVGGFLTAALAFFSLGR